MGLNILVVDHSQDIGNDICGICQDYHHTTKWVSSGRKAVEEIDYAFYDIVFIDSSLGKKETGGLQAARGIRRLNQDIEIYLLDERIEETKPGPNEVTSCIPKKMNEIEEIVNRSDP